MVLFTPHMCNRVGTTVLGIPFKTEEIMKYPDQWSVKPTCKHYCITVSSSGYTFTSPQETCAVWALQSIYLQHALWWYCRGSLCYVHCDNWRIDIDEHIHSSFVHSWWRPTWRKHSAISCYWLVDSAMYVLIKIYSPVHYGLSTIVVKPLSQYLF